MVRKLAVGNFQLGKLLRNTLRTAGQFAVTCTYLLIKFLDAYTTEELLSVFFSYHNVIIDNLSKSCQVIDVVLLLLVEYKDEMTMIPKNSSVVVRRIPVGPKSKAQLAA